MDDHAFARSMWTVLEPVHVVTYFSAECAAANKEVGLRGFWMGYFGSRGAPLGPVGPGVIEATFHGFHPAKVRRAVPDAWSFAAPEAILRARSAAAATALRRLHGDVEKIAERVNPLLARIVADADATGRTLFAANRDLTPPDDPVEALWQHATSLREHRGDGHVAVLTAEGLGGAESNILAAAVRGAPAQWLKDSRGWSDEEWAAATENLARRGLLDGNGEATDEGRALREAIEDRTNALAAPAYRVVENPAELFGTLRPVARAVIDSGELPFPNPSGLPRLPG
ncbi:SCO6745 family protein [Actinomadura kijaniata]|uniref:SCO6745 family protein n=1 Tax=Actinomadura kijaniata TaxID=46161 RepID=UPI003F1AE61C